MAHENLIYSLALRQACRVAMADLKDPKNRLRSVAATILCDLSHDQAGELMRLAVVELLQMPGTPIRPQALDLGAVNAAHVADSIKALKG